MVAYGYRHLKYTFRYIFTATTGMVSTGGGHLFCFGRVGDDWFMTHPFIYGPSFSNSYRHWRRYYNWLSSSTDMVTRSNVDGIQSDLCV